MSVDEWDQRELCPDGACTGVIGPDGTCKVCGHVATHWGDERMRGLKDPEEVDAAADGADEKDDDFEDDLEDDDLEDDEDDEDDEADDLDEPVDGDGSAAAGDWGERQLCSDGACIGVIGRDGKCSVCGKRARGAVARLVVDIETSDAVETTDEVRTADDTVKTPDAAPAADPDEPEASKT